MKRLTSLALAAGLAISLSTAADAAATLVGSTTNPTGINGLVVDGTTYNVTFSTTTLNTFTQGTTLSTDATAALVAAVNSLNVTGLGGASPTQAYVLDVDNTVTFFDNATCFVTCNAGGWVIAFGFNLTLGDFSSPSWGDHAFYTEAADFTPVGVPEPAIWSMLLTGFFGIGAMARHMRRVVSRAALA